MLISIASCQLAVVLHSHLSSTRQKFNNHTDYVRDRCNCCNLFLKVHIDDELRKSPDKPFHILTALKRTKS